MKRDRSANKNVCPPDPEPCAIAYPNPCPPTRPLNNESRPSVPAIPPTAMTRAWAALDEPDVG